MIHKMTFRSNPRLVVMGVFIVGLPVVGVLATIYWSERFGIVLLVGAAYITYLLIKFLLPHLRSQIETSDTGIACHFSKTNSVEFRWEDLTYAGLYEKKGSPSGLFLYDATQDQIVTIPSEFSDFDLLRQAVKDHTAFQTVQLASDETIKDWLRKQLHIEPQDTPHESSAPTA